MRILVDIPDEKVQALNTLAQQAGRARAEIIREALDAYVATHQEPLSSYFGLWADNPDTRDAQAFLDRLRKEWER